MSSAIASVILRSPFTVAHSSLVSQLLHGHVSDVTETRKGRHWEFTDGDSLATLTVFETRDRPDFHDELLEAGLTTDRAPEIVLIAYPAKTDRDACGRLAVLVSDLLAGLNRGVGDG